MLATFVIGLREGLEAALIVSIVAAFLRQQGRMDLLRWVFVGVISAAALCAAGGIALDVLSKDLPQKQQEGLETIVGAVAVAMVTYMVVWMRRHSRELKGQLEGAAASALAAGSGMALVAMAFLAVLREGFETVVFLLAAFNESNSGSSAGLGAALGIVVAIVLGYALYRGGIKINLSKFFRATGIVLVLVAAGLVVSALRTAHEAGWINFGQQGTVNLSSIVEPGSVQASLLTGMLGVQAKPVLIEVVGWLVYLVPVGLYIAWPPGRGLAPRAMARIAFVAGAVCAVAAVVFAVIAPADPGGRPVTRAGELSASVVSRDAGSALVDTSVVSPADPTAPVRSAQLKATHTAAEVRQGIDTDVYSATTTGAAAAGRPSTISYADVAKLNGGRLPLGAIASSAPVPVTYADQVQITLWVDPSTSRVIDVRWSETLTTTATLSIGPVQLGAASEPATATLPSTAVAAAVRAAQADEDTSDRRGLFLGLAIGFGVVALLLLLAGWLWWRAGRRPATASTPTPTPAPVLLNS